MTDHEIKLARNARIMRQLEHKVKLARHARIIKNKQDEESDYNYCRR